MNVLLSTAWQTAFQKRAIKVEPAIPLTSCGAATYRLIRNLVAPNKLTDKDFAALVALVKAHH